MIDEIPERDHNPNHSTTNSMSLTRLAILLGLVLIVLLAMLLGSRALDTLASKLWPAPLPSNPAALNASNSNSNNNSNKLSSLTFQKSPEPAILSSGPAVQPWQSSDTREPSGQILQPNQTQSATSPLPQPSPNQELAVAGTILNPLSPIQTDNITQPEANVVQNNPTVSQGENKTDITPVPPNTLSVVNTVNIDNTVNAMKESSTVAGEVPQAVEASAQNISQTPSSQKEGKESKTQQNLQASKEQKNKDVKQYTTAEKEILKDDPRHYTVQILGMHNKAKLQNFVNEAKLKGKVRYCRGTHQGKPWYILVYGNYGTKEEAQKIIAELPEEIKKQKPWVRSYASLQGTIHARE